MLSSARLAVVHWKKIAFHGLQRSPDRSSLLVLSCRRFPYRLVAAQFQPATVYL